MSLKIETTGIEETKDIFSKLARDMESLQTIASDPFFEQGLRELIAENESEVWASEGGSIGESWNGNTLVDTGALKASMTNPNALRVQVQGNIITFGSNVSYAGFVNDKYVFAGLSPAKAAEAAELIERWLVSEGTLIWE
jgi:phage gpG-like protein